MRNMKTGQLLIDQPMQEPNYPYKGQVRIAVEMSVPGFLNGKTLRMKGWTSCSYEGDRTWQIEILDWEEFLQDCEVTNLYASEEAQLWEEHYDYVLFKLENELNNSWYHLESE